jgi:hypothetical protein
MIVYVVVPTDELHDPYVFAEEANAERFSAARFNGEIDVIRATVIDHDLAERMIAEEQDEDDAA